MAGKWTMEQIEALQHGRELDEFVLEHVFGYQWFQYRAAVGQYGEMVRVLVSTEFHAKGEHPDEWTLWVEADEDYDPDARISRGGAWDVCYLPITSNMDFAWKVVDKMRALDYVFTIEDRDNKLMDVWKASFVHYTKPHGWAMANRSEIAICHAALFALLIH